MKAHTQSSGKIHFAVLDGLRGVASLIVVIFHLFEIYAPGDRFKQRINHGYLAVDFFFLLSGFVIAFAYDDRWSSMTQHEFYRRRLIRLQPMVIFGFIFGAALFFFQKCSLFPLIGRTSPSKMLLVMLLGFTMVPLLPRLDIRGWGEMYPLNGAAWSLFFEYFANVLYGTGFRKVSNRVLTCLVLLSAALLIHYAVFGPTGDVLGGWSVSPKQLRVGFVRLFYPFFTGMLLMRLGIRLPVGGTFALCTLLLTVTLAFPRLGGPEHLWVNGLYESFCIILVFPLIVCMGAGERLSSPSALKVCRFLGELSYPLYVTHYPLMDLYFAWVTRNHIAPRPGAPVAAFLFAFSIAFAWASLKLYDEPVRAWLSRNVQRKTATGALGVRSGP